MKNKGLFFVLPLCFVLAGCVTVSNTGSASGELLEGDPAVISGVTSIPKTA